MDVKRRQLWWQFRLRTLLVAVVLVSITQAWVACSLNWIRERDNTDFIYLRNEVEERAPGGLWIFGETAASMVVIKDRVDVEWTKRLYPEAKVILSLRTGRGPDVVFERVSAVQPVQPREICR